MINTSQDKYLLKFQDNRGLVILRMYKDIDCNKKCFDFSINEKQEIEKWNLNECSLTIYLKDDAISSFIIVSPYTSKTFRDKKKLLCDTKGKLKLDYPICID